MENVSRNYLPEHKKKNRQTGRKPAAQSYRAFHMAASYRLYEGHRAEPVAAHGAPFLCGHQTWDLKKESEVFMKPRQLVSLMLAGSMVFSMTPATAVTAFADSLSSVSSIAAENEVAVTVESFTTGNLSTAIAGTYTGNAADITALIIKSGELNAQDFYYIRDDLTGLVLLDLSGTTCVEGKIPDNALYVKGSRKYNDTLKKFLFPKNVTEIGADAFNRLRALSDFGYGNGNLQMPDSVTKIGASAFAFLNGFTSIKLPSQLEEAGGWSFAYCQNLSGTLVIPGTLEEIPQAMFETSSDYNASDKTETPHDNYITNLEISEGVKKIGSTAFHNRTALNSVMIPSTMIEIGGKAFQNCTGLDQVPLNDGLTTIGYGAFQNTNIGYQKIPATVNDYHSAFDGISDFTACNAIKVWGTDPEIHKIYIFSAPSCVTNKNWTTTLTALYTNGGYVESANAAKRIVVPAQKGKFFAGWYETPDLTGTASDTLDLGHTYYAKWGYEVKFDTKGYGTKPDSVVLEETNTGLAVDSLPTLSAEDLAFEGWYTDTACRTKYNGEAITQNTTLYAKWKMEDGKLIVKGGTFTYGDAEAAAKGSVPAGSVVTVALNDDFGELDHWEIQSTAELKDESGNKIVAPDAVFTFVMPQEGVLLTAVAKSAEPVVPEDVPTGKGTDALQSAVIVGAAAAGTAVLVYSLGTRLYLNKVLPAGTAIPTNRAELALLVWNSAGKPEPTAVLSADAAETDKAIAWAVENDLLKAQKINGKAYAPTDAVSRLDVIRAWNKVQERS